MSLDTKKLESRAVLAPGAMIDGRYRLKTLLGAGGGGEVWEAEEAVEAEVWRSIALKLLKMPDRGAGRGSSPSPQSGYDWLHEARAVSQVSCEALPHIYMVGVAQSPAVPFIAMELLTGDTLAQRLDRGPVHWRKALAIAKQIAVALDACHDVGVVHCDLKPRNVFLENTGKRRVLVLDFGVATLGGVHAAAPRSEGGTRTHDETDVQELAEPSAPEAPAAPPIIGTPGYISPERLSGILPDYRDDAFALGVVLHRMIAGRMPQRLPAGAEAPSVSPSYKKGPGTYEIALHRATVERMFDRLQDAAPATPRAVVALVERLLGSAAERPAKGELAKAVDEVYRRPHGRPEVPYAGLEAFGERRIGSLPGRGSDIEPIVRRLGEQVGLVLCGPSGAGKSSLAVAGVAARVDEEMLLGMEGWVPVVLRPSSGRGLYLAAGEGRGAAAGPSIGTFVVVDQLEEVLSLSAGDRRAFCQAFAALVTRRGAVVAADRRIEPGDAVRVVATVRDDLFGRVAALPELERLPESNLYVVRGVDPNAAREIVVDSLEGTGFRLEQGEGVDVVAEVARELEHDASALPLVQFALARLWDRRDVERGVLRARSWREIGGIMGALGEAAQGLYEGLDDEEQQAARRLFLALFDVEGTRNVVDEAGLDGGAVALVPRLVKEGLIRRRAEEGGRAVIEPLHEALAKGWPLLGRWLDEVRADRELVRDAQRDAARWERLGRSAELLWRGALLKNAEVLGAIQEELGRAFVDASLEAEEHARRRGFWLNRVAPAVAISLVLATALVGWWTTSSQKRRTDEANRRLDSALVESKENEKKATASEKAALEQKGIAEHERANAEAAKEDVAKLAAQNKEDYEEVRKATTLRELEAAKRKVDEKRRTEAGKNTDPQPSSTPVVRPPPSVIPPVGSPWD